MQRIRIRAVCSPVKFNGEKILDQQRFMVIDQGFFNWNVYYLLRKCVASYLPLPAFFQFQIPSSVCNNSSPVFHGNLPF